MIIPAILSILIGVGYIGAFGGFGKNGIDAPWLERIIGMGLVIFGLFMLTM